MLICHLTESFAGGVAKHITDIINNGDFANHILIYSSSRNDTDIKKIDFLINEKKIRVIKLEMGGIKSITSIPLLKKLLNELKPDLLHAHSSYAGITGRLAAKNIKIPVIYTPHGFAFMRITDIFSPVYIMIEKILTKFTAKIVAVSNSEKRIATEKGIAGEKITVINNCVNNENCELIKDKIRMEWGILTNEIVISTLGRPGKQKGYDFLFEIIKNIDSEKLNGQNIHFIVPMGNGFKKKTEHIHQNIKIDYIPSVSEPYELLVLSDIYISTARWEGGPYGILEAMQFELPVIATDIPGNADYVVNNETGLLMPMRVKEFVNSMIKLINDDELRLKLGKQGKKYVNENFTLSKMINKYRELTINAMTK